MFYVSLVLTRILYPNPLLTWKGMLAAALFVNGFHPVNVGVTAAGGWSIADEAIFYMLLPLLFVFTRTVRTAALTLAVTTVVSFMAIRALAHHWPEHGLYWGFTSMIAELPVFLCGMLTYNVWKRTDSLAGETKKVLADYTLCISGLLWFLLLPFAYDQLVAQSFAFMFLLLSLMLHPKVLFVNRALIFLGKISFSVYLVHFYIFFAIQHFLTHHFPRLVETRQYVVSLLLGAGVAIPISTLTWMFIEKPGIAAGSRLIAWLEKRKSVAIVPPLASAADTPEAQF